VSDLFGSADINAEGVSDALQLVGNEGRLRTATTDQLTAASAFLTKALASFPHGAARDPRRADAIGRLETAAKAIGAEMRRRAFDHGSDAG